MGRWTMQSTTPAAKSGSRSANTPRSMPSWINWARCLRLLCSAVRDDAPQPFRRGIGCTHRKVIALGVRAETCGRATITIRAYTSRMSPGFRFERDVAAKRACIRCRVGARPVLPQRLTIGKIAVQRHRKAHPLGDSANGSTPHAVFIDERLRGRRECAGASR